MVKDGRYFVTKGEVDRLLAAFSSSPECNGLTQVCSVRNTIVVVGDQKFHAQLLGKENMSGSWCMCCDAHPSQWNVDTSRYKDSIWMIYRRIKELKDKITKGELKQAKDKLV
jgi:hypothetical protein